MFFTIALKFLQWHGLLLNGYAFDAAFEFSFVVFFKVVRMNEFIAIIVFPISGVKKFCIFGLAQGIIQVFFLIGKIARRFAVCYFHLDFHIRGTPVVASLDQS